MSACMKKYRGELKLLSECKPETRNILFKHAKGDFIRAIVDAIWTTLEGKVPLDSKQKSQLKRKQLILRKIISANKPIKERRRLLCRQEGGNAAVNLINTIKEHF